MSAVPPIVRKRMCSRIGCGTIYETPHPGDWPARFCSRECHRLDKQLAPRKQRAQLRPVAPTRTVRTISPASPQQRDAIRDRACVVCAQHAGACHPAHLIDRGVLGAGQDDPLAVVPLCPPHHRAYDEQQLSLLEHLEPHWREHLAFAVERYGLLRTLERVTGTSWWPERGEAA